MKGNKRAILYLGFALCITAGFLVADADHYTSCLHSTINELKKERELSKVRETRKQQLQKERKQLEDQLNAAESPWRYAAGVMTVVAITAGAVIGGLCYIFKNIKKKNQD